MADPTPPVEQETEAFVVWHPEDYRRLPQKVRENIERAALRRMAEEEAWIGGTDAESDERSDGWW